MTRMKCIAMILVWMLLSAPHLVAAADPDLSGWWNIVELLDVSGELQLKQSGSRVVAKQRDADIAAVYGDIMFEGEVTGNVIKGRVITVLPGQKEICGKNWGKWVNFELTLAADGNRLEGKWMQYKQSTSQQDCPVTGSTWRPWSMSRTAAPIEEVPLGPTSKDYLIGAISILGFAAVFLLIRNAYVNYLVGSLKRSPNSAGFAGWALFGGLLFGSAIGCAALVSTSYMVLPLIATLSAISVSCLVICAMTSRKK